jgi:hypothetical protein
MAEPTLDEMMNEPRRCPACKHEWLTKDGTFRNVPQRPDASGIAVTMIIPLCPKCGTPSLVSVAHGERPFA